MDPFPGVRRTPIGGYVLGRIVPSEDWLRRIKLHKIYLQKVRERLERWRNEAAAADRRRRNKL